MAFAESPSGAAGLCDTEPHPFRAAGESFLRAGAPTVEEGIRGVLRETIDPRIRTQCMTCPPDPRAGALASQLEFTVDDPSV